MEEELCVRIKRDRVLREGIECMLAGNPRADNLFVVVSFLQRREGVSFRLKAAIR